MTKIRLILASIALIAISFGTINSAQKPVVPWTSHSTYGIDKETMDFVGKTFDEAGNLVSTTFDRINSLPQVIDKVVDNNLHKLFMGSVCLTLTCLGSAIVYKAYTSTFKPIKVADKTDSNVIESRRKYGIFIGSTIAIIGVLGMGCLCYYQKSSPSPIPLSITPPIPTPFN